MYAGKTDTEKALNLSGLWGRHYDTAGRGRTRSIALTGMPLCVTRRQLKDADNPDTVTGWQGKTVSARNALPDLESK